MKPEFSGIERRLQRLRECLLKLEPLKEKEKSEFVRDPYLRDIVERNLEVAAQACIDIANRIISIEHLEKPRDGFRNVLIHEYLEIDWEEVYQNLQGLKDLYSFLDYVREWMKSKNT
ncbi:MAG: DUF86 domain-containing protein [Deltaproteobacteria bacterium]|nr:DUF86 domain-containing protein [Deltaproteobacteria bacterium]